MFNALRRHASTILIAMVVAAVTAGGPALADGVRHALFAHNADKVDGKHAVGAGASASARAGKLVATNSTGRLPNGIIAKAPDADKLDGVNSAGFLRKTAKAANADKLDGADSTAFARNANLSTGSVVLEGATSSTSFATLDEFTVDVPAAGVLNITVAGLYWLDADSTTTNARVSSASLGLCDTANSADCGTSLQELWFEDADNATSDNDTPGFTLTRTVPVTAGPRTFYVNGASWSGATLSLWDGPSANVVWMPSALGVTSD